MFKPLPKELREELNRDYIGIPELCKLTGRSDRGLHYHINCGNLPHIKVDNPSATGFKYMILKEDAVRFLEERGEEVPVKLINKIEVVSRPQVKTVVSKGHIDKTLPIKDSLEELRKYVEKVASENNYVDHCTLDLTKEKHQLADRSAESETFIERVKRYFFTVSLAIAGKI